MGRSFLSWSLGSTMGLAVGMGTGLSHSLGYFLQKKERQWMFTSGFFKNKIPNLKMME